MKTVHIHITGPIGSGKSALAGEIEILCKALGLEVSWPEGRAEKNMTGADWQHALELYKPSVVIRETHAQTAREPMTDEQAYDLFGVNYQMPTIRAVEAFHRIGITAQGGEGKQA